MAGKTIPNEIDRKFQNQDKKLRDQVLKLKCLIAISDLGENLTASLEDFLQGVVDLIHTTWMYDEEIGVQVILENKKFKSKNFRKTKNSQTKDILLKENKIGSFGIYYLHRRLKNDEKILLKEQRKFINDIVKRLERIIDFKMAQRKISENEKRLQLLVENMPVMLVAHDKDLNYIAWNKESERVTGYRADEVIGNSKFDELMFPDKTYRERMLMKWPGMIYQKDSQSLLGLVGLLALM